uniref:Tat protein n=1 Tax=Steinernema glaseri TaxID=37863 RepID=A0A1I7ZVC6_9BILA
KQGIKTSTERHSSGSKAQPKPPTQKERTASLRSL